MPAEVYDKTNSVPRGDGISLLPCNRSMPHGALEVQHWSRESEGDCESKTHRSAPVSMGGLRIG